MGGGYLETPQTPRFCTPLVFHLFFTCFFTFFLSFVFLFSCQAGRGDWETSDFCMKKHIASAPYVSTKMEGCMARHTLLAHCPWTYTAQEAVAVSRR